MNDGDNAETNKRKQGDNDYEEKQQTSGETNHCRKPQTEPHVSVQSLLVPALPMRALHLRLQVLVRREPLAPLWRGPGGALPSEGKTNDRGPGPKGIADEPGRMPSARPIPSRG